MAKINKKPTFPEITTHEGAPAHRINIRQILRRSVCSCMLWEDTHYEEGVSIANRISELVPRVSPDEVAALAIEAREQFKLRHVPLLLVRELARAGYMGTADALARIIQRPDELAEFLSIYWKDGRQPLSAQVKKGLAAAFPKFNAYQLAKYNRPESVKLRDVLRLCHATPRDLEQATNFKALIGGFCKNCGDKNPELRINKNNKKCNCGKYEELTLPTPDTWEVALSAGKNKKETWERLMKEGKLNSMAFLRNLRNMSQERVDRDLIKEYSQKVNTYRVLPFRFIAAAKAAPEYEEYIDAMFLRSLSQNKIAGRTIIVIDVSGSMYGTKVSEKSDMDRAHAACALGAIAREKFEDIAVYATAGNDFTRIHKTQLVPARRGMALVDAIYDLCQPLGGGGIFLTPVCDWLREREQNVERMIVITDEQDCAGSGKHSPLNARPLGEKFNYLINVASYQNGIGYGRWTHLDGFSEAVINWIPQYEMI